MTKKEAWTICLERQHAAWARFCQEVTGSHSNEYYHARRLVYRAEYDAAIEEWTKNMGEPRSDK